MADQPPTIITPVVFFGYEDRFDATPEQQMAKRMDFRPRPVQADPAPMKRESVAEALENDRCGICGSVDHFREDCTTDPKVSSVTAPASDSSGEQGSRTSQPEVSAGPVDAEKGKQGNPDLGADLL